MSKLTALPTRNGDAVHFPETQDLADGLPANCVSSRALRFSLSRRTTSTIRKQGLGRHDTYVLSAIIHEKYCHMVVTPVVSLRTTPRI